MHWEEMLVHSPVPLPIGYVLNRMHLGTSVKLEITCELTREQFLHFARNHHVRRAAYSFEHAPRYRDPKTGQFVQSAPPQKSSLPTHAFATPRREAGDKPAPQLEAPQSSYYYCASVIRKVAE